MSQVVWALYYCFGLAVDVCAADSQQAVLMRRVLNTWEIHLSGLVGADNTQKCAE